MAIRLDISGNRWLRPALIAGLLIGLLLLGHYSGIAQEFDVQKVRESVRSAGPLWLGLLVFCLLFTVGLLLHIPGVIFVAAALILWEGYIGYVIAFGTGLLAVCVSFVVVRKIGGDSFHDIQFALVQAVLSRLDKHPVLSVVVLRAVFWMSSPLNYALALTPIQFRDYLIGSAIGLLFPITAAAIALDWFIS